MNTSLSSPRSFLSRLAMRSRKGSNVMPESRDKREILGIRNEFWAVIMGASTVAAAAGGCDENNYNNQYLIVDGGVDGDAANDVLFNFDSGKDSGKDATSDAGYADAKVIIDAQMDSLKDALSDAQIEQLCETQLRVWAEPNVFEKGTMTKLFFQIGEAPGQNIVSVKIKDETGSVVNQAVKTFYDKATLLPGLYPMLWDGKDDMGKDLPLGSYTLSVSIYNPECGPLGDEIGLTIK